MSNNKADEKTIILPLTPKQEPNTTILSTDQTKLTPTHSKTKKIKIMTYFIIFAIVTLSICVYTVYEYKYRQRLTNNLIKAIQNNNINQSQLIISEIKKHNLRSNEIDELEKKVVSLERIANIWKHIEYCYNNGQYSEAKELLADFTLTSMYRDHALNMLKEIKQKDLNNTIESALLAYTNGERIKAIKLIDKAIEMDPNNQKVISLRSMVNKFNLDKKKHTVPKKINTHTQDQGDNAYINGDFDKAFYLWSHSKESNNSKKAIILTNIKKYITISEKALKDCDYQKAVSSLKKVIVFMNLIGLKNKSLEYKTNSLISDAYSGLGNKALKDSNYSLANEYLQKSIMYNANNTLASQGFFILNEEAKNIYKKAYMLSDANLPEACKLYKQALEMAQKDSDVYKKIKRHLTACE